MYRYQSRKEKQKKKVRKRFIIFVITFLAVIFGALIFWLLSGNILEKSIIQMPFKSTDTYLIYENGIIYIQGDRIIGINEKNEEQFNLKLNTSNVKLAVSSGTLFAYSTQVFQAVDLTTSQTLYSKEVNGKIMDVAAGKECLAVLRLDDSGVSHLDVYDMAGKDVTQLEFTYALIDFGFIEDQSLWTLELDTTGSLPVSKISIYKDVGKSINGIVTVEGQIIQKVLFTDKELFLVGTNHVIYCNYLGENRKTELIYGWYLRSYNIEAGEPLMLFSPRQETLESSYVSAVRIVTRPEKTITLQLLPGCIKILPGNNKVYVFTNETLYEYNIKGTLITKLKLPVKIQNVVSASKNKALLMSETDVYMVTLP
ncbi:MAG: DUF5711 family protein [Christensenellales bacterium]